ncbi:sporulation kinase E [Geobacter sp. OR-1]|uniref:sensor histidine kinase n=1 Tax=Geobacter sp. OR-1 TaxID=1266765 RepID=UPI00054197F2|nr:HAMP domain-containing sensor histidine kinase [Geobacter sp. OR-1]GAM09606.1 sporulation kinase E [Geobacter sp. OR-1]
MPKPRFSIRLKLTIGSLLPLFVAILFCSMTGIYIINSRINGMAQDKVRTDLNSAREVYTNEIGHIRDVVRFSVSMPHAADAVTTGNREVIAPLLFGMKRNEQLDFLTMVDVAGRVLFRAGNPQAFGDRLDRDPLVMKALQGEVTAGSQIFSPERLQQEGKELASRAIIDVIPTERAKPGVKKFELSGMVMVAAAPIRDRQGTIVGALYGGMLLNKNNTVVDRIKQIVFEGVQYRGKDVGTATIFLDDTRISTNVQTVEGHRAIGTRLSAEVYNRVILNREKWVDRAFVVNDWYFTAYEPIFDLGGAVIGSLYVGMLEQPHTALKKKVGLLFAGVLLAGSLFGLAVSGYIGRLLSRPILELKGLVQRFSTGERDLRIEKSSADEIGELADEFNTMIAALRQREYAIIQLNRSLEAKVQERTAELQAKNLLLVKTQEELVRAEKLAAVGELAAGVAHEINNPMAIIRGNAEVLLMELPPGHPSREEAEIISRQVARVKGIVGQLLSFARRQPMEVGSVAVNPIMAEILDQVKYHVSMEGIKVHWEPSAEAISLDADGNQLRQVFTNLIVNAVQSMEDGGILTVRTALAGGRDSCLIEIGDTGVGIPQERLKDIFSPFFTTKQSGTGLGLSVSYGIIKDHGGTITVRSEPGAGTVFLVTLPLARPSG